MSRTRAAALFALVGAAAAAVHVLTETPGALRDWRQTLPLAVLLGALLGAFGFGAPHDWRAGARRGVVLVLSGLIAFALIFAVGHAMISGAAGFMPALSRSLAALAGPTGVAALGAAATAGSAVGVSRTP